MQQPNESSVQFSLRGLMDLEEERLRQEEEQAEAERLQEEQARAERARAEREAEEQRLCAEAEARQLEAQRRREEEARLEAIRLAELEKARAEQEHAARMAELAARREHERQLAAAQKDAGRKKLTFLAAGLAVLLVAGGALGGNAVMASSKDADDNAGRATQALAALEQAEAGAAAQRRDFEARLGVLKEQVAEAKNAAESAQREFERCGCAEPKAPPPRPTASAAPVRPKCADPNDPLCGEL